MYTKYILSIPRAVSYTHLDVYKRQRLNRSSPNTTGLENSTIQAVYETLFDSV